MALIGCKPPQRHTEQHDVFFGIGPDMKSLLPHIQAFWPEAGKWHLDGYRPVTVVEGYQVRVVPKQTAAPGAPRLFFLNLGGYKPGEFEEYHYKMLAVSTDASGAIQQAKATAFFKHTGVATSSTHIDDKYGVDVDDIMQVEDILPPAFRAVFSLELVPAAGVMAEDELQLGYFKPEHFQG